MTHVEIIIQSLDEKKPANRVLDPKGEAVIIESHHLKMGIIESGTASGKTSVMLGLKHPDGSYLMVQITGDLFNNMHSALIGAKERFGK